MILIRSYPKWFLSFSSHVEHIIIMKLIFLTHPLERELSYAWLPHEGKIETKKKNFQLITRRNSYKRCSIGTMRWNNCTLIFHFPPIVFTFSCVFIRSARSSHLCHVPMLFTHMEVHSLHVWNKSSFILWLIYQKKLRCKLNPGQLILLTPHRLEHNNAHLHAKP